MFRDFVEHTIDEIRNVDAGLHMIIVQEMYLWYLGQNLQVRRPNIAIENHLYHDDFDILKQQEYANTAWRFNQPFFFGEMGGIPDLTSLAGTERFIQNCYNLRKPDGTSQRVGWMYLWYNPDAYSAGGISPTPEVWTMLENNLYPDIKYPDAYSP
ncbi:MAG: hypothetical protein OEY30_00175 [Candidatus Bathyarchaeota archaeon]|nr:hypothetical protein [Candidatus Bathyarchaeota archaeon]